MTSGDAYNVACSLPEALRVNCPEAKGPDHDFGSSPILVDLPNGRRALIAGQKSGVVHAVDPDRGGEILWQTRVGKGSALGGVQWGSAYDGRRVYVALSDVIPETAGTAAAPPTPPGQAPSPNTSAGGGLFALDPSSGQIVWTTPHPGCGDQPGCSPAQSAAVTAIPGIVFSGGIDGHLRAYATDKGAIVWDVTPRSRTKRSTASPAMAARSTDPARSSSAAWCSSIPDTRSSRENRATCCSRTLSTGGKKAACRDTRRH